MQVFYAPPAKNIYATSIVLGGEILKFEQDPPSYVFEKHFRLCVFLYIY